MRKLALGTLAYGAAFHCAYVLYIYPQFEYAHYLYFRPRIEEILATYAFLIAPLIAYKRSAAPAAYGTALIFALSYVPGQLVLMLAWQKGSGEQLAVQACLAVSMGMLIASARAGFRSSPPIRSGGRISLVVHAMTLMCVLLLIIFYRDYMRLVSFSDVYDLRSEAAAVSTPVLTGYLLSWLSYCFLPFLTAHSILRKNLSSVLWVLLGSTLIYAATGAKSSVLLPFIVIGLSLILGRTEGEAFLPRLVWSLAIAILFIVLVLPDDGVWIWVKSLVLLRTLGTGGWVLVTYYEYFSENAYTFYTHIGPIGSITGAYPYGDLSLGQVIGREFAGSTEANFNANFWASDGFAAMGIAGIPIVTIFLCALLYAINRVSHGYPYRFVALWMTGFWFALLNLPLTTAVLSGGGAITMLLLWSARLRWGSYSEETRSSVSDIMSR